MKIFPTRTQWRSWSLPSQLTAVGAYLGAAGLLASLIAFGAGLRPSPRGLPRFYGKADKENPVALDQLVDFVHEHRGQVVRIELFVNDDICRDIVRFDERIIYPLQYRHDGDSTSIAFTGLDAAENRFDSTWYTCVIQGVYAVAPQYTLINGVHYRLRAVAPVAEP